MISKRLIGFSVFLVAVIIIIGLIAYSFDQKHSDDLKIAIVWPETANIFFDGAQLAVDEVNNSVNLLKKRINLIRLAVPPLETIHEQSQLTDSAIATAQGLLADHPDLLAVIGHGQKDTIPAANIYETNKVLFISPTNTENRLTNLRFEHVLRLAPDDTETGKMISHYCNNRGYKRVAILHDRSENNYEIVAAFSAEALDVLEMLIPFRRSLLQEKDDRTLIKLLVELQRSGEVDAVFIATNDEFGARLLIEGRKRGINSPFIGVAPMDTPLFWDLIKDWEIQHTLAANIIVPTVIDTNAPEALRFSQRFQRAYGKLPEQGAALAYDAVNLIAHGLRLSERPLPIKIADELHYMAGCTGVSGSFRFNDYGARKGNPIYFKMSAVATKKKGFHYLDVNGLAVYGKNNVQQLQRCNDMDQDNDNIFDNFDKCINNTPDEIAKGVLLDVERRGCPLDSDLDGYPNYRDRCPNNTPEEITHDMDDQGCLIETDSDSDGVPDVRDTCRTDNTQQLVNGVDTFGCPVDSDSDKVPDYRDACLHNAIEEIVAGVDSQGCPIDSDADKVPDYRDSCPHNTTEEITTGVDVRGCQNNVAADSNLSNRHAVNPTKTINRRNR